MGDKKKNKRHNKPRQKKNKLDKPEHRILWKKVLPHQKPAKKPIQYPI